MGLRINDTVPNFTAETDQGTVQFHDWIGDSWAILFPHPKDFTPVCTTEFSAVAQLNDEWAARNTKVIGVSVDGVEDHKKWKKDIEEYGKANPGFPIIADDGLAVSKAFDMLPAEAYLPDGRTPADSATVRIAVGINPLPSAMATPMSMTSTSPRGSKWAKLSTMCSTNHDSPAFDTRLRTDTGAAAFTTSAR